jgi:hypothetical protein
MQSLTALVPIRKLAVAAVTAGVVYVLKLAGVHYASADVTTAVNAFLPLIAAYVVKDPAVQKVAAKVEASPLEQAIVAAAKKAISADPTVLPKLEQQLLGVLSVPVAPVATKVAVLAPVDPAPVV